MRRATRGSPASKRPRAELAPGPLAQQRVGVLVDLLEGDVDARLDRPLAQQARAEGVDRADEAALGVRERLAQQPRPLARRPRRASRSSAAVKRARSSAAALRVKVTAASRPIGQRPVAISSTMRPTRLVVLPVPAAASTSRVVSRSRRMRSRAAASGRPVAARRVTRRPPRRPSPLPRLAARSRASGASSGSPASTLRPGAAACAARSPQARAVVAPGAVLARVGRRGERPGGDDRAELARGPRPRGEPRGVPARCARPGPSRRGRSSRTSAPPRRGPTASRRRRSTIRR